MADKAEPKPEKEKHDTERRMQTPAEDAQALVNYAALQLPFGH